MWEHTVLPVTGKTSAAQRGQAVRADHPASEAALCFSVGGPVGSNPPEKTFLKTLFLCEHCPKRKPIPSTSKRSNEKVKSSEKVMVLGIINWGKFKTSILISMAARFY